MHPSRRGFVRSTVTAGLALSAPPWLAACAGRTRPTNIVLIFADDQGYGDVGVFGAEGYSTPHLDRLAAEGMRFTNFYASEGVCSASRASLLTGCYAPRVSIFGALSPGAQVGLHPDEVTIAELLKPLGYATAAVGKWHLGHGPEFLPRRHGFDEYFGLPYSNDMWPVDFDGAPVVEGNKSQYPPLPLIDGDEVIETVDELADQDQLTTRYTDRAVRFVDRSAGDPFFLYLAHSMPHVPLGVSDAFRGSSEQGMYGDVIQEMDWSVGQVLDALDRNGVAESTLVVYTSDNGPWLNYGDHAGSSGPLREGKGTAFEGGPRVPAIMRWPGRIPPGTVCDRLASTIDVLPTVAAITGAPLPAHPIDGVNVLPLLLDEDGAEPRTEFWYYYTGELRAVREGRWKLVFSHRTRSYVGVEPGSGGHPGPYAFPTVPGALYDLETDVGESTDVAAAHPEVVGRLTRLGERAREALGDRLTQRVGAEVRPPGRSSLGRPDTLAHAGVAAAVLEATPTDPRYPGAGPGALVDGMVGSGDFRDGRWLAYEGIDFEATLDLGAALRVARVGLDCLQLQSAWVLLPRRVTVAISEDGLTWRELPSRTIPPEPDPTVGAHLLSVEVGGARVRYVRVHAANRAPLPSWHAGAGNTGWLFVDEIVVEEG
jgi:arylsulfatase A-like enzyme